MSLSKHTKYDAKDVLNGYKNNKCRLCGEMFCCPECRLKHESKIHDVHEDCSICIYGFIVMKQISSNDLMHHIIDKHLFPRSRCAYCEIPIVTETLQTRSNSLCTFTNFTDDEINQIWQKLPQEFHEGILNNCSPNNLPENANKTDVPGGTAEEIQYESPTLDSLKRQNLFEKGDFANSTPVQQVNMMANDIVVAKNAQNDQDKVENFPMKNCCIPPKKVDGVLEDSSKIRKVQFNLTPLPLISKSPCASFHVGLIESSMKKCKNDKIEGTSKVDLTSDICYKHKTQPDDHVDNLLKDQKEKVTVSVKPIKRDLSKSSFVETDIETTNNDSQSCHWTTAIEELSALETESFKSNEILKENEILIDVKDSVHKNDGLSLHSTIKPIENTERITLLTKPTWTDLWIKYKCKFVEFTRKSAKRPRSELDSSIECKKQSSTPCNDYKRRRLEIRARRPIHYYIKPQVKQDVKKINRRIQTSLE